MTAATPAAGAKGRRERRVLLAVPTFEPARGDGGMQRHIDGLLTALADDGYRFRVVSRSVHRPGGTFEVAEAWGLRLLPHILWADVVHTHGARMPMVGLAGLMALALGRRVVYTPHCYYDSPPPARTAPWRRLLHRLRSVRKMVYDQLVERALLTFGRTILLTEDGRRYLMDRGLPVSRSTLIPNCVNRSALPMSPRGEAPPLAGHPALLSVSRLDEVKHLHVAIMALTRPELREAHLHVVGKGPDGARLRAVAEAAGVADRVCFHGFVDDEGVAAMAASADVFVLPSRQEGLPTTLIEMLLRHVPVVASDIPGNRAVLAPVGLEAFLFPLDDVHALATTVIRASRSPVSGEAVDQVAARFTWETQAKAVAALYD